MKQNKETLKEYFETGDKPTQEQYSDLIDSYINSQQETGDTNRRFVIDENGDVNVKSELKIPEYTLSEIENNKLSLLKDGESVKEIDLTSYIDDTNLARLISGTVDKNGLATFTRDNNSSFTVDFSSLLGNTTSLPTNLSYEASASEGKIISSTGNEATIPLADKANAGLMKADFYEEGDFEPFLYSGENQYTVKSKIGSYIRIGNLVHFSVFFLNITDPLDVSGNLTVKGLPFNQVFHNHDAGSISELGNININEFISQKTQRTYDLKATVLSNNTVKFRHDNTFSSTSNFSFGTNGRIGLSGVYKTNIYTP